MAKMRAALPDDARARTYGSGVAASGLDPPGMSRWRGELADPDDAGVAGRVEYLRGDAVIGTLDGT